MTEDEAARWAVLDPAGEPPGTVKPTLYIVDELLLDEATADEDARSELEKLAEQQGWELEGRPLEERDGEARFSGESSTIRLVLRFLPGTDRVTASPDAWLLLRQVRATRRLRTDGGPKDLPGVSLNHILSTDPFKTYPFKTYPFKTYPFKTYAPAVGMDSYAVPGLGGRQPVTYVGPAPGVGRDAERTPVVAVFDTGCGEHPWFPPSVMVAPRLRTGNEPIGIDDPATDPERHPTLGHPLEGFLGDAAGHGTFIAGIIRQTCPEARIMPVRVSDGAGYIRENELLAALGRLLSYMRGDRPEGAASVDVLNLSFGYFHETAEDPRTLSELASLLDRIRALDCVVVCSAGNEATDRETFPAALAQGDAMHVSVGALNPDSASVALFSNIGDWVRVYLPGVSIVSTLPVTFDGSIQPGNRDPLRGRRRDTLDVDDFHGGFAVWSGTSFAAPLFAGRVAAMMAAGTRARAASEAVIKAAECEDHSRA